MGTNRKLFDQGTLQLYEAKANGANKVTIQAPATLAADYTLTLPVDDGTASQFLQSDGAGALSWANSTATLQTAYDNGAKIDADGTVVEIEVAAASGNTALLIDQDDNQKALDITKDGVGAGDAISILNAGTGRGIFVDQDGAAIGLEIDQDGSAVALSVNQGTANVALDVTQQGAAAGINVTGGAASAITASNANNNRVATFTKTGAGAGDAIFVDNDGTGSALSLQQDGAGIGLQIQQNAAGVGLDINQTTGNAAIQIDSTSTGEGIDINCTSGSGIVLVCSGATSAPALSVSVSSGAAVGSGLTVDNTGTGSGIFINQDGNARALRIDSEATSQPLIDLAPVTGNTRGDIAFGTARTAAPSSPSEGDIWYDGTADRFEIHMAGAVLDRTVACRFAAPFGPVATNNITTGSLGVNEAWVKAAAETGVADDLDTISSVAVSGDVICLQADTGDTITVKHNTGNIHLDASADKVLVNNNQLLLKYNGTDWEQITPMMVLP